MLIHRGHPTRTLPVPVPPCALSISVSASSMASCGHRHEDVQRKGSKRKMNDCAGCGELRYRLDEAERRFDEAEAAAMGRIDAAEAETAAVKEDLEAQCTDLRGQLGALAKASASKEAKLEASIEEFRDSIKELRDEGRRHRAEEHAKRMLRDWLGIVHGKAKRAVLPCDDPGAVTVFHNAWKTCQILSLRDLLTRRDEVHKDFPGGTFERVETFAGNVGAKVLWDMCDVYERLCAEAHPGNGVIYSDVDALWKAVGASGGLDKPRLEAFWATAEKVWRYGPYRMN